jgi:SAM-dependent methyltransferase
MVKYPRWSSRVYRPANWKVTIPQGLKRVPFVDPVSGTPLESDDSGWVSPTGVRYPIDRGIPRFVSTEGYAASFGLEWNMHGRTQLDSNSGTTISRDRLLQALGHPLEELSGRSVLEPGCGSGRFTEHLLASGASVYAFDLSTSVDASRANFDGNPNLVLAQANVLAPPFPPESFDAIVCLGLLQYTPSAEAAMASLWRMLKPGGRMVVDQYRREVRRWLKADQLIRIPMTRLSPEQAMKVSSRMVKTLFPAHWAVRNNIAARAVLTRLSPVYVYASSYPNLSKEQHYEWSTLDTYNHLTGRFQKTTTVLEMLSRLRSFGGTNIQVFAGGNGVIGRASKPGP